MTAACVEIDARIWQPVIIRGIKTLRMRILVALIAVAVFVVLFVIDTTALMRLGFYCVAGGCGVSPMWFAILGGALAIGGYLVLRRPPQNVKKARVAKVRRAPPARAKAGARSKPKPAK